MLDQTSAGPCQARDGLRVLDALSGRPGSARAAVVGSLNADLRVSTERLPRPGETVPGGPLDILPGGKSANQAAACALLGVPTALIGAVGQDTNGRLLLDSLGAAGVDTSAVSAMAACAEGAQSSYPDAGQVRAFLAGRA